jgi:circadian clock protein KaiC
MEAFKQMALHPERLGRFFTALANELSGAGVTTLYTLELPGGTNLQNGLAPVSAIAEYVVMLRYAELATEIRRTLTIRKSRRSHFDPRIREFSVGGAGLSIGDVLGDDVAAGHRGNNSRVP